MLVCGALRASKLKEPPPEASNRWRSTPGIYALLVFVYPTDVRALRHETRRGASDPEVDAEARVQAAGHAAAQRQTLELCL